jgi:hypothetical protein
MKLSSTYCHPIPHSNFQEDIAISSLLQFREMVDDGVWLGPDHAHVEPKETEDAADDEEDETDQSEDYSNQGHADTASMDDHGYDDDETRMMIIPSLAMLKTWADINNVDFRALTTSCEMGRR